MKVGFFFFFAALPPVVKAETYVPFFMPAGPDNLCPLAARIVFFTLSLAAFRLTSLNMLPFFSRNNFHYIPF